MIASLLEELAPGVWHGPNGLFHEHAFLGNGKVDATRSLLARNPKMVAFRVVSEEGEHKPILAPG